MRISLNIIFVILLSLQNIVFGQGFNTKKTGIQTFYFNDPQNRNQLLFTSETLLETFTGITTDIWGEVSFDPADVQNTMKGKISISASSIKTGIDMRDEELYGSSWLETEKYPIISFTIKEVDNIITLDDNKIKLTVIGQFDCHGKVKDIITVATLTFLEESSLTQKRISGDLISVVGQFKIYLSDYDIRNMFIPKRVSDEINISIDIVGTNIKPK